MFINFSNHPSEAWEKAQLNAAMEYGEVIDIPFPAVNPYSNKEEIYKICEEYAAKIMNLNPSCVLCQGEFCVAYGVISALKKFGVKVVAACSERKSVERKVGDNVEKTSSFSFVQFREYE